MKRDLNTSGLRPLNTKQGSVWTYQLAAVFAAGLMLVGCEDGADLQAVQRSSIAQAEAPSGQADKPRKDPADDDRPIDEDDGDYDGGHDDDDDCHRYGSNRNIFHRSFAVGPVEGVYKLSLADQSNRQRCLYERDLLLPKRHVRRTVETHADRCNGFRNAQVILAKNGRCRAQENVVRDRSFGQLFRDHRVVALDEDCVCYYSRELKILGVIEMVRKRFVKTDVCAQLFDPWSKFGRMIPAPDNGSGG